MEKVLELEALADVAEGKVIGFGKVETMTTAFGETLRIPVKVDISGKLQTEISVFARKSAIEKGYFHPRSNIAKLLLLAGVRSLQELVGKKVKVHCDKQGFYKFLV